MLRRSVALCALALPLLLLTATGCSTSDAAPAARDSQQFTVSPTPRVSPTPTPSASLPPGAKDVWEMGLTGDLYADLETHYDGLHVLTGDNGMISAADWVAMLHEDICESDTEPMGGLGSQMDNRVRIIMSNPDDFDAKDAVQVIASYGCPEREKQVHVALLKAG